MRRRALLASPLLLATPALAQSAYPDRSVRFAKHARPFSERQIGRDDHRGLLVEAADQVKQQLPAGLGEWQIAQLIQHHEIHPAEILCQGVCRVA